VTWLEDFLTSKMTWLLYCAGANTEYMCYTVAWFTREYQKRRAQRKNVKQAPARVWHFYWLLYISVFTWDRGTGTSCVVVWPGRYRYSETL